MSIFPKSVCVGGGGGGLGGGGRRHKYKGN